MRITQIEGSNLRLFDFDFDLSFMVFFLSPNERIYARYGGRAADGWDGRHSLDGLKYTMQSVLQEHQSKKPRFAPEPKGKEFYIEDVAPRRGRCLHCHQAKEVMYDKLDRAGKWNTDLAFRYPPPDNLGMILNNKRGNVLSSIKEDSDADKAGLRKGDTLLSLNGVPVHSFGDAQFALDRAPKSGSIEAEWQRGEQKLSGRIGLSRDWRRADLSWRSSLRNFVPTANVYGKNLSTKEKEALGLDSKRMAFRQKDKLSSQAEKAGVKPGDIIIGVNDKKLEMSAYKFLTYVSTNFVKGEVVELNVIRDSKRLKLKMKLE